MHSLWLSSWFLLPTLSLVITYAWTLWTVAPEEWKANSNALFLTVYIVSLIGFAVVICFPHLEKAEAISYN